MEEDILGMWWGELLDEDEFMERLRELEEKVRVLEAEVERLKRLSKYDGELIVLIVKEIQRLSRAVGKCCK